MKSSTGDSTLRTSALQNRFAQSRILVETALPSVPTVQPTTYLITFVYGRSAPQHRVRPLFKLVAIARARVEPRTLMLSMATLRLSSTAPVRNDNASSLI